MREPGKDPRGMIWQRKSNHDGLLGDAVVLELVLHVLDLGTPVGRRQAVFAEVDEDHFFHGEDAFARDLVAHFTGQGDGGAAELGGGDAQFDDVALARGADKVDFGDVLGDNALVAQLDDRVDRRFFVDPAQQAAAEQGAVGVEVFGFYPFAGVEVHGHSKASCRMMGDIMAEAAPELYEALPIKAMRDLHVSDRKAWEVWRTRL